MALPSNVTITREREFTRISLPIRVRTNSRALGLVPIIFGLFFIGFALLFMASSLGFDLWESPPLRAPIGFPEDLPQGPEAPALPPAPHIKEPHFTFSNILGALFGLPFLIAGIVPIALGILSFFASHAEVHLNDTEICALESIGPFRFRQRRLLSAITGISIAKSFEKSTSYANYGIVAQLSTSPLRPLRLTQRYPLDLINAVAPVVLQELRSRAPSTIALESLPPVALAQAPTLPAPEPGLPQPPGSKISCIATPDSITLLIPRTGFHASAKFFLLFSLFWNAISVPFFCIMLVQLIKEPSLENLGITAFLSLFVAIGTAFFLAGIQSAFRKSVFLATRDSLIITQTGPLRNFETQWTSAELASIRCADSNTTVNGRRLKWLVISSKGDNAREVHFFTGRDEPELQWLASMLHDFYALPRPAAENAP